MRGDSLVCHWLSMNEIGVVIIKNEELCVALAAWDGETAGLMVSILPEVTM